MTRKPGTFTDLIAALGGVAQFSAATGINEHTAKKMRDRNSIAPKHWPAVIAAASAAGLPLSADDLLRMRVPA